MEKEYRTILNEAQHSLELKKSNFICSMKACLTEEEALDFIEEVRKKYRDANHNCYAYIIGADKLIQRYSDDKEPQGTAGIPMLEVLKKEDLTNIVCVVTRYFGGIKLGASGLIRAYGGCLSEALKGVDIVWMQNYHLLSVDFAYNFLGKIDNYIENQGYYLESRQYLDVIKNNFWIKCSRVEEFKKSLNEITAATCTISFIEERLLAEKDGCLIKE
ncbi:YigZ family protein [Peptoniphilaceae bacterium SGI.131]